MNDREMAVLMGELKEFKRETIEKLQGIRRDVRALSKFKRKVTAWATFASTVASFLATVIVEKLRNP